MKSDGRCSCTGRVTLLSNIPHYHAAAEALYEAGLLDRYITSWTLFDDEPPSHYLPAFYKQKLDGRRLRRIPPRKVIQYRLPEFLQKALPKCSLTSADFATNLNNWMFDNMARSRVRTPCILHFVNTLGYSASRQVRRRGGFAICDSRQAHPLAQNQLLAAEAEKRGLPAPKTNERLTERMLGEYESAGHIIVPSSFAMRTLTARGIDPAKVSIVPYGVDPDVFPAKVENRRREFTILFVGTLGLRKGVLYLLEAVKNLRLPHVQVICIGALDAEMELPLRPYQGLFLHLPNVPKVQLKRYYQDADVFVLPSLADAYPLAVLEAAVTGLPVITTTNVGSCDLLTEGRSGLIVPPGDAEALATAILSLYSSEDLREEMGRFNLSMLETFTWDAYKKTLIDTYKTRILASAA